MSVSMNKKQQRKHSTYPAPAILAPWMTANPTAPSPNTATLALTSTLQVFQTAPKPVDTPHPNKHAVKRQVKQIITESQRKRHTRIISIWTDVPFSKGNSFEILAQLISARTVYSAIVEHPMKWKIGLPSLSLNRLLPSGITPAPVKLMIHWAYIWYSIIMTLEGM